MKNFLILCFVFSFSAPVLAEIESTVWEYVDARQEKKEFKRWSLSNWFYQKETMRLQDQWLLLNLDDGFIFTEFYTDYSNTTFDQNTQTEDDLENPGIASETGLYLAFLGFTYRYEKYDDLYFQKEGALNLRLIGSSHQATHLILTYGNRYFADDSLGDFDQKFYGGDISLYLTSFLGFDGRYRIYNETKTGLENHKISGTRTQWGVFVDLSFLRLFATQFEEDIELKGLDGVSDDERQVKGTSFGARIYI